MAEDFGDVADLAVEQRELHLGRVTFQGVHAGEGFRVERGERRNLLPDDRLGAARLSGEGDDQRRFELVEVVAPDAERIDDRPLLSQEFDVVQPAEGGGVVILAAAGETEVDPFDLERQARHVIGAERKLKRAPERFTRATTSAEDAPRPEPAGTSIVVDTVIGSPTPPQKLFMTRA